ncbi:hypothetical protein SDC9_127318 [bioreactor metagenome]|uniref:Uncharacterized protein n=1 Tax=bioreactor metagenome TaxID=1076179 RepID=A0A645CTN8_9ZZZZ
MCLRRRIPAVRERPDRKGKRGYHQRHQERHRTRLGRPALAGPVVPASQAWQGQHRGAHQDQEHRERQDRRPHLPGRHQDRHGSGRPLRHAVPVRGRHRLCGHGHHHLRSADHPGRGLRGRQGLPARGDDDHGRHPRRKPAVHRSAGQRRARGDLHRARSAG